MSAYRHCATAFSLVEVALALALASFSLIAIFGLLPVGLKTGRDAVDQANADRIIAGVAADLRATPPTQTTSQLYSIAIPASGVKQSAKLYFDGNGTWLGTVQAGSVYLLTINFAVTSGGRLASLADLKVTWPALAPLTNASGSVENTVALDRN